VIIQSTFATLATESLPNQYSPPSVFPYHRQRSAPALNAEAPDCSARETVPDRRGCEPYRHKITNIPFQSIASYDNPRAVPTESVCQLRLYFSSFAYVLLHAFRRLALRGSRHEKAQSSTLRVRFLKIATRIQVTTRRVWLSMSESYPWQHDFEVALHQLRTLPCRSPPP